MVIGLFQASAAIEATTVARGPPRHWWDQEAPFSRRGLFISTWMWPLLQMTLVPSATPSLPVNSEVSADSSSAGVEPGFASSIPVAVLPIVEINKPMSSGLAPYLAISRWGRAFVMAGFDPLECRGIKAWGRSLAAKREDKWPWF